ncbi:hypothetical protein DM01DRAFT_1332361 [Hesseltinella vesiculosa]|uniref:Maintenance of telomere capping protein 1 n=1 Tax=Hesseltinella vesiculosa TaxID=101127 RepID=A0A1X2GUS9_9FUNG|nr:hypothetical protein DM01DRAFT_1332361 [Hesseltinella vesiculosa]
MSIPNEQPVQNANSSLMEAEKFLASLELSDGTSSDQPLANKNPSTTPANSSDLMSFLDEISNYSSQSPQPTSQDTVTSPSAPASSPGAHPPSSIGASETQSANDGGSWMSWGNSLLAQATAAVKNTTDQINRTVQSSDSLLEDRVKHLQTLVNKDTIEKLGSNLRQLTTQILETVAPPISEHELVEIWLSHDMKGYHGVDALVYRAFARVMEQTEAGQVIVRKGFDDDQDTPEGTRELNMCDGIVEGTKLAKANVDHLVKTHYTPPEKQTTFTPQSGAVPVIQCPVFMVIQPVKTVFANETDAVPPQLMYAVVLQDPTHQLHFQTFSQSIPLTWLDIPYEENEWVEDKMIDVLRAAVTTVAQDYVWTRMTGGHSLAQAMEQQTSALQQPPTYQPATSSPQPTAQPDVPDSKKKDD